MKTERNNKKDEEKRPIETLVIWLAEKYGLIENYKQEGRNELIAEIHVIDRKIAGECMDKNLRMTASCAIEVLKDTLQGLSKPDIIIKTIEEQEKKYQEAL